MENQCFERIPIYYQNKLQFEDQVTRKTFPRSIKAPCKSEKFDQQMSLDADGEHTYPLTRHPIKARDPVRTLTLDEVENRFTHAELTAQQLGIYSQKDWNKSIDKMKFNQLVDDAAEKFEVVRAVNFADLTKRAQLQAQFPQLRTEYIDYFNKRFFNGEKFNLHRLGWRDLINGNHLKEPLIGIFGYPCYVFKEIAILCTVFNFLQCFFGLFRSAFNTYKFKITFRTQYHFG